MSELADVVRVRARPLSFCATLISLAALALLFRTPDARLNLPTFAIICTLTFAGDSFRTVIGRVTDGGHGINWSEGAAVLALAALTSRWAIVATFVGVTISRAFQRRKLEKCLLNGSAYALQMGLATVVAGAPVTRAFSWSLLTGMTVFVFSNVVVFELVYRAIGVKRPWVELRRVWLSTLLSATATSMLAVLGIELARSNVFLLVPFFALAFGFIHLNRQNLRMGERFQRTEHLYNFTKSLTTSARKDGPMLIAESVQDALSAKRVDVVVDLGEDEDRVLLCTTHEGENLHTWVDRDKLPTHLRNAQHSPTGHLVTIDGEHVITAPLPLQNRVIGAVSVVEPSKSGKKGLTDDDVRLIETMAQHAAIWLDNGRLVDELRVEIAQREHEAFHDALTDLPNRRLFNQRAEVAIAHALAHAAEGAVMLLDLDEFKEVNDALGHVVGDELLLACGEKISKILPQSAMLARLGGDEFAILLPTVNGRAEPLTIARAIADALDEPMAIRDMSLRVDASIGIAYFPDDATDASVALQRADVAMYTAKQNHTGVELYSTTNDFSSSRKLALQAELKRAIGTDQIQVWYQPKVQLATNEVVGVECLVRWQHPLHGMVYPDEFIPQAEQSGLIGPLSMQIMDIALRQQRRWRAEGIDLRVAVNLSVRNLLSASLAREVAALLDVYATRPGDLVIEITETAVMSDPERAKRTLRDLHALGIHLAVDDFGVGQSSLAYLQELPIDEVKIDRCFVTGIERGEGHDGIARTVVDLGKNLDLRVVAEGIETEACYQHLRLIGCEIGQGYFIARPMPVEAIETWLVKHQPLLPAPVVNERVVAIGTAGRRRRTAG